MLVVWLAFQAVDITTQNSSYNSRYSTMFTAITQKIKAHVFECNRNNIAK